MTIQAPEHFCITLQGSLHRVNSRVILQPGGLPHLLERLLTGGTIAEEALEAFGIRVLVDEDMDQGDG